jgi:HSP20 family protein
VDIVDSQETLVVKVELPGVRAEDLDVHVTSGNIVIQGEKARPELPGPVEFQLAERSFGSFRRVIPLGLPVNTRQARATLKNGLLRICFPKVPNRRGEAVPIEVQGE